MSKSQGSRQLVDSRCTSRKKRCEWVGFAAVLASFAVVIFLNVFATNWQDQAQYRLGGVALALLLFGAWAIIRSFKHIERRCRCPEVERQQAILGDRISGEELR